VSNSQVLSRIMPEAWAGYSPNGVGALRNRWGADGGSGSDSEILEVSILRQLSPNKRKSFTALARLRAAAAESYKAEALCMSNNDGRWARHPCARDFDRGPKLPGHEHTTPGRRACWKSTGANIAQSET
jgi:hypothetical protein